MLFDRCRIVDFCDDISKDVLERSEELDRRGVRGDRYHLKYATSRVRSRMRQQGEAVIDVADECVR